MTEEQPPNRAQRRAWPKRRQWLDRVAGERRFTAGAKSWLLLLAGRSDDAGKPVWGAQEKMADQLGRCSRTVRRYLVEGVQLGYIKVYPSKGVRDAATGRWCQRRTNTYYFVIPARDADDRPAPRRRQRAPYCVIRPGLHRRSHRADTDGRSSPLRGAPTGAAPPANWFERAPDTQTSQPGRMSDAVIEAIEAARAALAAARGGFRDQVTAARPPMRVP